MTTLEKLGILGIRSFSPETLEILAFEKPLTLIVGHNGAGKTTIVECLKMATTGELPPNAGKGQYFIHNAKSPDILEVKGQIRLVFRTANKKKILANRSFQLLHTKDRKGRLKTSYKALESVLQVKDIEGTVRSINKKCVEMDYQIPQLMGVSKAILENVVFCHQEDSHWPLGEMSKLKKKFDDLFGATRYSKALEAINSLRKEHQKIGKEKLHDFEMIKTYLDQAEMLREKIEKSKRQDEQLDSQARELNIMLQTYENELNELKQTYDTIKHHEVELEIKKHLLNTLQNEMIELEKILEEYYSETEEELILCRMELQESIKSQVHLLHHTDNEIRDLENDYQTTSLQKDTFQKQSIEAIRAEERLSAASQKYSDILSRINQRCYVNSSSRHKESIASLYLKIEMVHSTKQKELDSVENEAQLCHAQLTKEIQMAQEELVSCLEIESNLTLLSQSLQQDISRFETEFIQQSILQSELRSVQDAVNNAIEEEQIHIITHNPLETESVIAELRASRQKLSTELETVSSCIHTLESNSFSAHKLLSEKAALLRQEESLKSKIHYGQARHTDIFGTVIDINHLKINELCLEIDRFQIIMTRLKKEEGERNEDIGHCLGKIQCIADEISKLENEHRQSTLILNNHKVTADSFEGLLQLQRQDTEEKLKQLLVTQNAEKLYANHLNHSIQKNKCAFCTRIFKTPDEVDALKKHLNARITNLPKAIEHNQLEMESAKERLIQLESLQHTTATFQRIDKLLIEKNMEKNSLEQNIQTLKLALETTEKDRLLQEKKMSNAIQLKTDLEEIKTLIQDIQETQTQIALLSALVEKEGTIIGNDGSDKLNTSKARIHEINVQLREIETLVDTKEKQSFLNRSRQLTLSTTIAELKAKQKLLQDKIDLLNEMRVKCKDKTVELKNVTKRLKKTITEKDETRNKCNALGEKLREAQKKTMEGVQTLKLEVEEIGNILNDLHTIDLEIKNAQEASALSEDASSNLKKLNEAMTVIMKNLQEKRVSVEDIRKDIEEQKLCIETIDKNLTLKKKKTEADNIKNEIDTFLHQHEGQDPHCIQQRIETLSTQSATLTSKIAVVSGEKKANLQWKHQHEIELNAEKYKNIDIKHRNCVLETETELMAIRDLQKYYNALDKALMKYHTTKMQEINRTIRELWQTMYKGKDIDFICIRSDTDEDAQFVTTGQRSYNYRVTMIKDGSELEMRGRCSSGQKVIASIVIRLALAESFCINCGILALDEPTTNLDRNNMDGLARALADLIEARRDCSNFQLILITHDEEFVRMLARHQPCDCFFQIKKNLQGYSTIRRADIRGF